MTGVTSIAIDAYKFSPVHVEIPVGTTLIRTIDDNGQRSVTFTGALPVDSGLFP